MSMSAVCVIGEKVLDYLNRGCPRRARLRGEVNIEMGALAKCRSLGVAVQGPRARSTMNACG